ncbi:MAG TPA: gluconate 2-dehydrogenase subunit 3 family protein [Candidatus Binatia bacterium]|nr:gluconate 2-dehydrogenase subunit 3 family protein [Candidatus Binatia bacterium]
MRADAVAEIQALIGVPIDRRRFLKGSAAGLVLLGAGSLLPSGCTAYPKPKTPLQFFSAKEYAVVNAAAERLLGATGQVGAGEEQIDIAGRLDAWLLTWDLDAQQQLRLMLRVFEHGTSLFDLQRKRFTRLSALDQDRYLDGWMRSTLGARRTVFRALKALASAGFYGAAPAWANIGYDGPWLGRVEATALLEHEAAVPLAKLGVSS